jgi:hypothetical protein
MQGPKFHGVFLGLGGRLALYTGEC